MAEGGYDFEMDEMNNPNESDYDEVNRGQWGQNIKYADLLDNDTSFNEFPYEGDEETTNYNTDDNSNLTADVTLTPGRPPNAEFLTKDFELSNSEDWIDKALKADKKIWPGATETGKRLLAGRLTIKTDKTGKKRMYYEADDDQDYPISDSKDFKKILSAAAIKRTFRKNGNVIAKEIKDLLYTPEEPPIRLQTMGPNIVERQMQETAETSFIERVVEDKDVQNDRQVINKIIDATEDELKSFGMSEYALREIRGLKKAGDDLAAVKAVKDHQIMALEEELTNAKKEYNELTIDKAYEKLQLEAEIEKLDDEIIEEKHKVWQINMERESQGKRIKNLLTDVIKQPDSKIPLKDRLKLLFKLEGFTISAIIAAVAMLFSTIGLAISNSLRGGGSPTPAPTPGPGPTPGPKPEPSITDRVKEGLQKLAEWLKELAKKSAAALPGIIGSIVAFILKSVGAAVGFMAEHVIIFLVVIVSSIIYGLIEGVKTIKKRNK